jgi:integrase/recombinase XerD
VTFERSFDLEQYHKELVNADRMRPGSIDKAMSVLARCEIALGHPLIEATSVELRDWLDGHTLVAKTRYAYISHLASFWRWAIIDERAERDPTRKLTRPRLRQDLPRPLSRADLATIIDQAPNAEIRAMLTIGAYAGLRCMEIAGLEVRDVLEHATPPVLVVANGKGGKSRVVPMAEAVVDALRDHGIPRSGPIFTNAAGRALKPSRVSRRLRDHMHACGVDASAHQLRHTIGHRAVPKVTRPAHGATAPRTLITGDDRGLLRVGTRRSRRGRRDAVHVDDQPHLHTL